MSLPIDYIFMNSRDKGVVIINILSSSRISIEFMMRNTILALDELYYRRPLYCPPPQHKLVHNLCCTLVSLLSSNRSSLPWSITIPYVKNVLRFVPPLENSWHRNTSHHHQSFLVPVLIPTSERCCLDSFLLATLIFWSEWSKVHS